MRDSEEECEEKVARQGGGEIYWKRQETKRTEEKDNMQAEKENSGEKGAAKMVNGDDKGEEADEEKEGTRKTEMGRL